MFLSDPLATETCVEHGDINSGKEINDLYTEFFIYMFFVS